MLADVLNSVPQGTRLLIEFHRNTQAFHLAEDRFRHARGPAKEVLNQKDDMTSGIVTRLRCALFNTAFGCIAQITKFGPWLRYAPEFVPVLSAHYAVWLATVSCSSRATVGKTDALNSTPKVLTARREMQCVL